MAVELVTQPRVLFCDEPTSGLDGRGAMMVARVMQAVTSRGVAVVSTIHQPSAAIFGMFDELLLLQRGGKIVFNGPLGADAVNLVQYLQGAVPCAPEFVRVGAFAACNHLVACRKARGSGFGGGCMHECMHAGVLKPQGVTAVHVSCAKCSRYEAAAWR
jgi:energy-coupling factor transporter ATP-binding protein EcfA2